MTKRIISNLQAALAVAGLLQLMVPVVVAGEVMKFENGIRATVHTPEEITAQWLSWEKGARVLHHPATGSLALADDAALMTPFDTDEVVAALASMHGFEADVDVEVFILPASPRDVGSSFARRGTIYLAPGTGPTAPSTVAYITTHEMGHVLTWAFLDDHPGRWAAYLQLRGLDTTSLDPTAAHADRAREILAEDIRHLFGGAEATASRSIENHDLILPDRVEGLRAVLAGYFAAGDTGPRFASASAFPNPCNPMTTIEMVLPENMADTGARAELRIFDIRGNLVSTLEGGHTANGRVTLKWNGTDRSGAVAASGRYLYVMRLGQVTGRGSVTLIR